jgi:UDP-N-acetylmuramoylalanine--D-glutamate ligase
MTIQGVELQGARVLVIGMAKSGLAAAELLRAQGAVAVACDSKALAELPGNVQAALQGMELRGQTAAAVDGMAMVVLSPGVPPEVAPVKEARRRSIPVLGELELASYFLRGKQVGITGTNGKTTTTALTGHVLRECGIAAQVGGNIGTPPSALVGTSLPGQWNVLELSSFQTESVNHFRADIGVCLNVTPDHLDRYASFEDYAAAKRRLFETMTTDGVAVLNADDARCVSNLQRAPGQECSGSARRGF